MSESLIERIKIFETEISSANILRVAAGTTGLKGGDSGHGGRTYIEIENITGSGDIEFVIEKGGLLLKINLGGDTELETIIETFEFVVKILRKITFEE